LSIASTQLDAAAVAEAAPSPDALRLRMRSLRRRGQTRALILIAPLLVFLLVTFLAPIVLVLTRSIDNGRMPGTLPRTAEALASWDGETVPGEAVFEALATDLKAAPREDVAEVGKQLNYYSSGLRSTLIKTNRKADELAPPYRDAFVAIDSGWGEPGTWRVIRQALPAYTDFYLLAALDMRRDGTGAVIQAGPDDAIYREVLLRTFTISAGVTVVCVALGYPLAYLIASTTPAVSNALLVLVLLPFWTSLLVRTTAWVVVLQSKGVVNSALAWIGLVDPDAPLNLIFNRVGVYIAMTHILLPFMVLPIYSVMKGIPPVYMRAAASLGASPMRAFLKVYLPLSLPGVSAGALLVFILALGYYITPALVGGPRDQMVSGFIAYFVNQVTNWGMAASLSAILLVAVLVMYAVYNRIVGIDRLRMG
jgi:putative spermidine/putrescine transport system permease protein